MNGPNPGIDLFASKLYILKFGVTILNGQTVQ